MSRTLITEHTVKTDRHQTFYLAAGPEDGPLIIFVHGWPEMSISWRHQLPFFAAMGFRAIAPDMRGYGRSGNYAEYGDYAQRHIVADMRDLLAHLGRDSAVWVGHDWGSPVVWNIASHHPEMCQAVASLCVPYYTLERGLDPLIGLVDRDLYPIDQFPAGQWEYMKFYEENFAAATAPMDANPLAMIALMFRKSTPESFGTQSPTAFVRQHHGWFGGAPEAPLMPRDDDVLSEEDLHAYASALERNGFFGPNAWYMNHENNAAYFQEVVNDGVLSMPVLFIAARYDYTCESITSALPEPMREKCTHLNEAIIDSGHWMAQEKPAELNRTLTRWLAGIGLL
ncbi:MAG: alpha/beta hydrolase [Pseudomonadales bacterium]|nr:alpha/beta hydrolase [Pseudomonadales bacterium]